MELVVEFAYEIMKKLPSSHTVSSFPISPRMWMLVCKGAVRPRQMGYPDIKDHQS